MHIVDTFGLPDGLLAAIRNDQYSVGAKLEGTEGIYSPSSLNTPPQIRALTKIHDDDIVVEAVTRVWSLFGTAIHNEIERATVGSDDEIAEERLFAKLEVDGKFWTISGMLDNMNARAGKLDDWKATSVWTVMRMDRLPEWSTQLNVYRWLAAHATHVQHEPGGPLPEWEPIELPDLTINAILRDWSWREAIKSDKYPQTMVFKVDIRAMSYEEIEEFMRTRIRIHQQDPVPDCTPEEQWYGGSKWVLRKIGNKRAVKTEDTMDGLLTYIEGKGITAAGSGLQAPFGTNEPELDQTMKANGFKKGEYYVIERPGERIRCARYCSVARFCPQAKREGTIFTEKAYGRNNQKPSLHESNSSSATRISTENSATAEKREAPF